MDGCELEELDSVVMGNVSLSSQDNWIAFKCFFFMLPLLDGLNVWAKLAIFSLFRV